MRSRFASQEILDIVSGCDRSHFAAELSPLDEVSYGDTMAMDGGPLLLVNL
jgi:hypothetical protein